MFKILKQVGSVWRKNIGSNIIVMIMICMTCYLGSGLFNQFSALYKDYAYFKDTQINRSLVFLGRETSRVFTGNEEIPFYLTADEKHMNEMLSLAEDSGIVKGISRMLKFNTEVPTVQTVVYDEITASFLKNPESLEGSWLFEEEKDEEGYYPVVVCGENREIGDKMNVYINLIAQCQPTNKQIPSKTIEVKAKVVGKVSEIDPFLFYLGVHKSNAPYDEDVEALFEAPMALSLETVIFFPYCDELFGDYIYSNDTAVFYFSDDASDSDIEDLYKEAQKIGYCGLGNEIMDKTKENSDYLLRKNFFMYFSVLGLMLTAVVCVSFLNLKKLRKQFSIFYLNGCSFLRSTAIYFIYFLFLYFFSFAAALLINELQDLIYKKIWHTLPSIYEHKSANLYLDVRVVLFTCILGILISMVAAVIPFMIMKHKTPMQNIKEG